MVDPAATAEASPPSLIWRLLRLASLALVVALLVLLGWKLLTADRGANLVAQIKAGEKPDAPAFVLPVIWERTETWPKALHSSLTDGRLSLSELRGYPVVVNFWASWCDPCKDEAPILAASARKHSGKVVFLGLDVQDFTSDARTFLQRYKANYVSVRDPSNDVYEAYGLTGVPETFYLDAEGRAVVHSLGQLSARELEAGIGEIASRR